MKLVEKIDVVPTIESKYILADRLWDRIAGSAFFFRGEKEKIRLVIETEPVENVTKN